MTFTDVAGARSVGYGYDAAGDLRTVTDLDGEVTAYLYDGAHNLTRITSPDGDVTRVTYGGGSRVATVTREVGGVDETTTFAYTEPLVGAGNQGQTVVTDANGHVTTYFWDNANRVERVTNDLGQNEDKSYDDNSNVTQVSLPAGEVTTFNYDQTTPMNVRNNLDSTEIATGATAEASYPGSGAGLAPFQATGSGERYEAS